MISLDSCNTFDDSSTKICVQNKVEEINFKVFNLIKGINDEKISVKHISWKCKGKFNGENALRTKNGIVRSVDASKKNQWYFLYVNNITLGILFNVLLSVIKSVSLVNIENLYW